MGIFHISLYEKVAMGETDTDVGGRDQWVKFWITLNNEQICIRDILDP